MEELACSIKSEMRTIGKQKLMGKWQKRREEHSKGRWFYSKGRWFYGIQSQVRTGRRNRREND